jgi:hypothetical protein
MRLFKTFQTEHINMSAVHNTYNNYHSASVLPPVKRYGRLPFHTSEIIKAQGRLEINEVMTKRRTLRNTTNIHFPRKQRRIRFKNLMNMFMMTVTLLPVTCFDSIPKAGNTVDPEQKLYCKIQTVSTTETISYLSRMTMEITALDFLRLAHPILQGAVHILPVRLILSEVELITFNKDQICRIVIPSCGKFHESLEFAITPLQSRR